MIANATRQGLKEWAVVVEALREGRQVFLLRKGGIHEKRGEFQAAYREFFLFPTFEHQERELLKPAEAARYEHLLDPKAELGPLRVHTFAELVEDIPLDDPEKAHRLTNHHVWTEEYVQMRIAYKPEKPLHLFLLRAHALPRVLEVPRHPRYAGCRSWLEFEEELSAAGARPALEKGDFAARVAEIKDLLSR